MRPYTYTPKSHMRPYIRNSLLLINDQLPLLHLHVNYFSQLQVINRRRLHDFHVLSQKRHTREAGAIRVAEIGAENAKDMIRVHLGALIVDNNVLLVEWFHLKTYTDGHTPLICSNRPTLQMNAMPFDMDGVCTIQDDGIPHPADMRLTIQIIERILIPHALSPAQLCSITDYRNHDAACMCVREFVRESAVWMMSESIYISCSMMRSIYGVQYKTLNTKWRIDRLLSANCLPEHSQCSSMHN